MWKSGLTALALACAAPAGAQVAPYPASFTTQEIATNGTTIHVRVGGSGPAVLLLHGYGETGDMWEPLAARLMRNHRVIIPDLRGLGLSAKPATGYDKKTQAEDMAGVLAALGVNGPVDVVAHDIGNWSPIPSSPAIRRGLPISC
jgi:pimeloyl-ACP methyl ester carboxylesterase